MKFALVVFILFIIINNFIFFPGNILSWDVFGYYLYLPLKFIYHDLGLNDYAVMTSILEKYHSTATFYQAMPMPDGHYVMKYSMGMSLFYAPFFFLGHGFAHLLHYPADGFSLPYQYAIFIGSIIYSITGIIVLSKVLMHFFNEKIAVIVLIIIVFATNYLIHITMYGQNAMSHNMLFTSYAIILWLTILWHDTHKFKPILLLGIICGLTILSRPSEIVCLIIPALWGIKNKATLIEKFRLLYNFKLHVIVFVAIVLLFGSFQLIYWKIFTGKFLFYSYGINAGEGFEFLHPAIAQVLFSFRKGWLLYTPVMIFAIAGFYFMYRKNPFLFFALFIYFILNLYIVSSWSCWWYASSFSQRALIPSYPIMAIALGYFLTRLSTQNIFLKASGYALIAGCIFLNLYQSRQFHYGIISGDRMTSAYYFKTFGKMQVSEDDKKLLLISRDFDGAEKFKNEDEYHSMVLRSMDFENAVSKDSTQAHLGRYSFKLDSSSINSPAIEIPYNEITKQDHAWIRVTAFVYPTGDTLVNPFSLVVHFTHNNYIYKYAKYDSEKMNLEINHWNKITFDYLTPEVRRTTDVLKIYFWNRGKNPVFVDDIVVEEFGKIENGKWKIENGEYN